MKKISLKIAMAVVMIAVGTLGIQAQNGRGTGVCGANSGIGNGNGTCVNGLNLTDEQKAILAELSVDFQAEMAVLRDQMVAATTLADKLAIFNEMKALRTEHQAEVKKLLSDWGVTVSTGTGTGLGNGMGNGMGNGRGHGGRRGK